MNEKLELVELGVVTEETKAAQPTGAPDPISSFTG